MCPQSAVGIKLCPKTWRSGNTRPKLSRFKVRFFYIFSLFYTDAAEHSSLLASQHSQAFPEVWLWSPTRRSVEIPEQALLLCSLPFTWTAAPFHLVSLGASHLQGATGPGKSSSIWPSPRSTVNKEWLAFSSQMSLQLIFPQPNSHQSFDPEP